MLSLAGTDARPISLPMCGDCWRHMRALRRRELEAEAVRVVLYGAWSAAGRPA